MSKAKKKWRPRSAVGYTLVNSGGDPVVVSVIKKRALKIDRPIRVVRECDYRRLLEYAKKGGMQ